MFETLALHKEFIFRYVIDALDGQCSRENILPHRSIISTRNTFGFVEIPSSTGQFNTGSIPGIAGLICNLLTIVQMKINITCFERSFPGQNRFPIPHAITLAARFGLKHWVSSSRKRSS